jgi:hypothetical protein
MRNVLELDAGISMQLEVGALGLLHIYRLCAASPNVSHPRLIACYTASKLNSVNPDTANGDIQAD